MTEGHANHTAATAVEGLEAAYSRDENDEFVQATAIIAPGETASRY
jgi:2,3-bisphosphoglycerate-independent phosphoglycerate mutase